MELLIVIPLSTRSSFAGVVGRDDATPDDVAVAMDTRCWLCG